MDAKSGPPVCFRYFSWGVRVRPPRISLASGGSNKAKGKMEIKESSLLHLRRLWSSRAASLAIPSPLWQGLCDTIPPQKMTCLFNSLGRRVSGVGLKQFLIGDGRTWAIAVRRGSYKSLLLLDSGLFSLKKKIRNSVMNFGSLNTL